MCSCKYCPGLVTELDSVTAEFFCLDKLPLTACERCQVAKEFLLGDALVMGTFEQCWGALIRTARISCTCAQGSRTESCPTCAGRSRPHEISKTTVECLLGS